MLVIDSCSIILLAKSTILEEFTKWKEVIITKGVYKEILEGKNKKFFDALLTEKLVEEKKIKVKEITNIALVEKMINDFGLGQGEAETIALANELKSKLIITDNKQGRKTSKIYDLNLSGSISVVVSLYKSKRISKEKAIESLNSLKKSGWFNDYLIEYAFQEVKDG